MAGKRREKGKPTIRAAKPGRRRHNLNERLARAATPQDRIAAAADHYRSALAINPDPAGAEHLVGLLVEAGDRLYKAKAAS